MCLPRRNEKGVVLIIALVFLVIITAFVVAGINLNMSNTRMVGNVQQQEEMEAAANAMMNRVVSNKDAFSATPAAAVTYSSTDTNVKELSNLGATTTVAVAAPNCLRAQVAPGYSAKSDTTCEGCGGGSGVGVDDTEWDVQANVTREGTSVVFHQGVAVRLPVGNCPP